MTWKAVPNATSYVLKWSTRSDLASPVYRDSSVVGAWMTNLRPATTYYVTVAAKNGTTAGSWAKTVTTTLQPNAVATFGTITAKPAQNGVTVSIPEVANASDYQVRWSAGPNENRTPDRWAPHFTPWSSAFDPATRTWTLPASDSDLTSVAYGNPIYVRAMARNTYFNSTFVRKSAQVSAWPVPTKPVSTDLPVHLASYNVLCSGCETGGAPGWSTRAPAIAATINAKDPDVLTVLEASGPSGGTGSAQAYLDLDRRLPNLQLVDSAPMTVSASHQGNRILYDPSKYTVVDHGVLSGIKDYEVYPASAAPDTNTPGRSSGRVTAAAPPSSWSPRTTGSRRTPTRRRARRSSARTRPSSSRRSIASTRPTRTGSASRCSWAATSTTTATRGRDRRRPADTRPGRFLRRVGLAAPLRHREDDVQQLPAAVEAGRRPEQGRSAHRLHPDAGAPGQR